MKRWTWLFLGLLFIVNGCQTVPDESETDSGQQLLTVTSPPQGVTPGPLVIATAPQATTEPPTESMEQASPTPSPAPSATPTVLSTPSATPSPTPTPIVVACEDSGPPPGKGFPVELDLNRSDAEKADPYMFLAAQQYFGMFDVSDPARPIFWGFWEIPDLPELTQVEAYEGVVYVSSGSTLQILNLAPECRFATVATIEMPFRIYEMAIEDDRLYVGLAPEDWGMSQVAVFSILIPSAPEELGVVDLGEGSVGWSVFEQNLFTFDEENHLSVTNVSNPAKPLTRRVEVTLDPDAVANGLPAYVKDAFYLSSYADGITIIANLREESPTIERNPLRQILVDELRVGEYYILEGFNSCDGIECSSSLLIFDARNAEEVSGVSLYPNWPVHEYLEVDEDLVYAFSNEHLLVIDLSDPAEPQIIAQVPLIT